MANFCYRIKWRILLMPKKPTYEELEQRIKELDKELQKSKGRHEDIIETALFGIYELDNSGKI